MVYKYFYFGNFYTLILYSIRGRMFLLQLPPLFVRLHDLWPLYVTTLGSKLHTTIRKNINAVNYTKCDD